jgi:urease accessory protein
LKLPSVLNITRKVPSSKSSAQVKLVLPFQLRNKSRLRTTLENGEEVGLILERGSILRGGDLLLADDGRIVEVVAEPETVSTVHAAEAVSLCRATYHLGNRHVALQIGDGWVRYQHDHVLDEMVRGLGLVVTLEEAPFEPEAGAYGGHSHAALAPHAHG